MSDHDVSPLPGRTVLVTGATSGIGLETARQLAERGATVLLHGRTAEEARVATDPAEGAAYVVRLCDPAVEIVNGAYYDRGERVAPAPGATEDRTIKRLNELADLLVGRTA
ncbi:SDR family NAD(P)-dependent oxidoreductase [Streptomyces sp. NPDC059340]|uniref:SDR family NAD(P)-dependent oxidoreductase n=1 Tax=Streptomyces sp. NPDC059340 TaxID=3346806 RepID=UPI0036D198B8